jgi:hypothetical protein
VAFTDLYTKVDSKPLATAVVDEAIGENDEMIPF